MGLGARDGDEERHVGTLKATVEAIYAGIKATELAVSQEFGLTPFLPEQIHFVHSQELLSRYPELDAKGRERAIAKELGAVFLIGIGGKLSDGKRHDVRAPDYDDWSTEVSERLCRTERRYPGVEPGAGGCVRDLLDGDPR